MQPIAVPAISADELRDITDNYGGKSLIGEGSYGRVFYGVLKSGKAAAIKKLDSSKQPDQEFLAQVDATKSIKSVLLGLHLTIYFLNELFVLGWIPFLDHLLPVI